MSLFQNHRIGCSCGNHYTVQLPNTVNLLLMPQAKWRILGREFHVSQCPACKIPTKVEGWFLYNDCETQSIIAVYPKRQRHQWRAASAELEGIIADIPKELDPPSPLYGRLAFGLEELREKILLQQEGLDDWAMTRLKAALLRKHPSLLQKPGLNLHLDTITKEHYRFSVSYDYAPDRFHIRCPRPLAERGLARLSALPRDTHYWESLWRWSPSVEAVGRLLEMGRDAKRGYPVEVTLGNIRHLPNAKHSPPEAQAALRHLYEYAKAAGLEDVERHLFNLRFNLAPVDDWGLELPAGESGINALFEQLPDLGLDDHISIRAFTPPYATWQHPHTQYSALDKPPSWHTSDSLKGAARHEMGHSIHLRHSPIIDQWLGDTFGWQSYPPSSEGIRQWLALMGVGDLPQAEMESLASVIRRLLGDTPWESGDTPHLPNGHIWLQTDFGPRLAFEQSVSNGRRWYQNAHIWYRQGGKAFSFNFYYKTLQVVDVDTLLLISNMPNTYAAMSPSEFFAELYALFYDLDEVERADIPDHISEWLGNHVGLPSGN